MAGGLTVQASNGVALPLDSLEKTYTYSGNFISTISVTYIGVTYVQTFTNDGAHITNESLWTPL
jgi:hypothetical protein